MSSSDTTYVVSYPYYAYYYCPAIIPVIFRYHLVDFLKCKKDIFIDLLSHFNFYEKSLSFDSLYIENSNPFAAGSNLFGPITFWI